jgi:hypothetical protein
VPEPRAGDTATARPIRLARLHPVSRRHLDALTAELGILQHAVGSRPDPDHGYCVDDVARALEVDLLHGDRLGWEAVSASAWRSLRYLEDAFDEATGRFRNFRAVDGSWAPGPDSEDAFGRAMLALGKAAAIAPEAGLVERVDLLFGRALPEAARVRSPRAAASVILACAAAPDPKRTAVMRTLATDLHARFRSFARPGWLWPEPVLTYEAALLPRSMIVAGQALSAQSMMANGLAVLDWLIEGSTAPDGRLSPVGNGWWPHGGTRSQFDQQPIEATSLLLASQAAFAATGRERYREAMERAYAWFLGANDRGVQLADPARGASRDALTPDGVNENEGAESTLMWLMAAEHIRASRSAGASTSSRAAAWPPSLLRAGDASPPRPAPLASGPSR